MSVAGTGNFRSNFSAEGAVAITPSDSIVFPQTRALIVQGTGNLTVRMAGSGVLATFTAVPAWTRLDISVNQVMSTGTTATNIMALS